MNEDKVFLWNESRLAYKQGVDDTPHIYKADLIDRERATQYIRFIDRAYCIREIFPQQNLSLRTALLLAEKVGGAFITRGSHYYRVIAVIDEGNPTEWDVEMYVYNAVRGWEYHARDIFFPPSEIKATDWQLLNSLPIDKEPQ